MIFSSIPEYLSTALCFIGRLLIYYIPCIVGAGFSRTLKRLNAIHTGKSRYRRVGALGVVAFAFTPSVIMSILDIMMRDSMSNTNHETMIGLAFLAGLVSEEISYCFMSIKTWWKFCKVVITQIDKAIDGFDFFEEATGPKKDDNERTSK